MTSSLCAPVSHERRVFTQHIIYRLYEGLTDPMMSTRHPRPLLILPFIHLYLSGVSGGIQLTGRTLERGQLGSLASVSPSHREVGEKCSVFGGAWQAMPVEAGFSEEQPCPASACSPCIQMGWLPTPGSRSLFCLLCLLTPGLASEASAAPTAGTHMLVSLSLSTGACV